LKDARSGGRSVAAFGAAEAPARAQNPVFRWAAAAAILLTVAFGGYAIYRVLPADPAMAAVRVESVDGSLFQVAGNWSNSVAVGQAIPGGQVFRTAKGSHAVVQLADGSRVEMNERSELSVSARRMGTTLHLGRGSIIVEAAKQGATKRLYVDSKDCRVAVVGTIFSVNHGTKGSRVSVIEGEVRVRRSGDEKVLHPGDQLSTNPALSTIPVASEIAWSRNLDRHLAVLAELTRLQRDIANLPRPGALRDTRLLELAPSDTTVFAAVPNVSSNLAEAHRMLRERLESSPALQEWWAETMGGSGGDAELQETIDQVRKFGSQFGDELVVTVQTGSNRKFGGITVFAELKRPTEFRPFLEGQMRQLVGSEEQLDDSLHFVEDPRTPIPNAKRDELLAWIHGDLFVASTSQARLQEIQAVEEHSAANGFAATSFHDALAGAYASGTSWLVAVDLERVMDDAAAGSNESENAMLRNSGLLDARHLIIQGTQDGDVSHYNAVLSFDGPRHGIASWLASPAPMGALEFVSPDATVAAAFVTRDPRALAQDLLAMIETSAPDTRAKLAAFERERGVDILRDFAAPLGGEFAMALDGPVLPTPSWKFMVEVYDPARLQQTMVWLVEELNRPHDDEPGLGLHLAEEQVGGRTWYRLTSDRIPSEVNYTFVDGYLVAAPARVLIDEAIARRAQHLGLPASRQFTALLPQDGNANFSAIAYQNLGAVVGPLAHNLGGTPTSGAQSRLLAALGGGLDPTLVYAYGEPDRIVAASTRPGGLFGSDLQMLLGLQAIFSGQAHLNEAIDEVHEAEEEATEAP